MCLSVHCLAVSLSILCGLWFEMPSFKLRRKWLVPNTRTWFDDEDTEAAQVMDTMDSVHQEETDR